MASLQFGGAQLRTKYQDCMGKTDRLLCTTNFHHFTIISYCENGGIKMLRRTTPCRRCTQCAHKCKRQALALATNSAFCRGFEPWAICYFKHHSTTQPHVTWCRRCRLSNRRRGRSKLLPHVMHLVVGHGGHHWHHGVGEVDRRRKLLPTCWGGRILLARDVRHAAGGQR